MTIRASVGAGGANLPADVRVVQQLLNHQQPSTYKYGPIAVDGLVGPQTVGAITQYQASVVRLSKPDGRVDPGGLTIQTLQRNLGRRPGHAPPPDPAPGTPPLPPPAAPTTGLFTLTFSHGGKVPTASGADMYESVITLTGPKTGTFRGSIYPDDMNVKGRLLDGTYDLSLTLHRKSGTPTAADLIVKTQGDRRPALTVNGGGTVPVKSNSPAKTTSSGINVHNGFNSNRGSEGCLTLQSADWSAFITVFLSLYPTFADWYEGNGSWRGKAIGTLVVKG